VGAVGTSVSFDVYVGEDSLLEVYRGPDLVVTRRFGHSIYYGERIIPLRVPRPSRRYRRWGWTVPALFALGCLIALWTVLS